FSAPVRKRGVCQPFLTLNKEEFRVTRIDYLPLRLRD
ncbi:MAG: hypothetical protein ACI9AF_001261, partial [Granulosicoccus sp.]